MHTEQHLTTRAPCCAAAITDSDDDEDEAPPDDAPEQPMESITKLPPTAQRQAVLALAHEILDVGVVSHTGEAAAVHSGASMSAPTATPVLHPQLQL
jgi:hypothetical protein